ncbi:hypothetical protein H5410_013920 [Solanum commersonii]|uniref:Uncharacterized protein n=1 Tax=Solanum commersonii TaxID=4109 RepID=A0A9J5ZPK2_SOLCO|nr:hypothetical protein H5410_013920 [Solanum commersonii]
MLDSLNEIDLVAFYTSFDAPSPSKMLTISPINIDETSLLNSQSPLDLNNPAPVPGPCSSMLSDHLFEGDLPENKSSESNILAASESLVVEISKQTIIDNLRQQRVLGERVFDMDIITKLGMDSLHDLMEIQSWIHLFQTKSHVLHEEEVREFYYNIEFIEDGSIHSRVGDKSLHLDEDLLGHILEGPREGIRSVVGKTYSMKFVKKCSKISNTRRAGTEGPGTVEIRELKKPNEDLLAKIVAFQEKLIKDNDEVSARLTLIIKSFSHQSISS